MRPEPDISLFDDDEPQAGRRERHPQSVVRPTVTASGRVSAEPRAVKTKNGDDAWQLIVALDNPNTSDPTPPGDLALTMTGRVAEALGHAERGWAQGDAVIVTLSWIAAGPWRNGRPQGPEVFLADRTVCTRRQEDYLREREIWRDVGFSDPENLDAKPLDVTPKPIISAAAQNAKAAKQRAIQKRRRRKGNAA